MSNSVMRDKAKAFAKNIVFLCRNMIDTIAVENEVADNMYQRSELDYLIYNAPLE